LEAISESEQMQGRDADAGEETDAVLTATGADSDGLTNRKTYDSTAEPHDSSHAGIISSHLALWIK